MFTKRSIEQELMDLGPDYFTPDEYKKCLQDLYKVNKYLGIFASTVKILKRIASNASLIDIGCGGGSFLLHLSTQFPQMQMLGVDIAAEAIGEAKTALASWKHSAQVQNVSFNLQDKGDLELPQNSYDVVLTTLVCHHLKDAELVEFLRSAYQSARQLVLIHDLQRSYLAQCLYALISPLMFRNKMLTHDGLISIRRGFKRNELQLLLQKARITNYQLKWAFPFRWELLIWK
jgi:2-polyprenyl-3-methyl-5-hydroxy-6-metoxy-1,4-benzoquinol methylase